MPQELEALFIVEDEEEITMLDIIEFELMEHEEIEPCIVE